jgi:hypothetical protein
MLFPFVFAQFSLHPAAILPNPVGHWLSMQKEKFKIAVHHRQAKNGYEVFRGARLRARAFLI